MQQYKTQRIVTAARVLTIAPVNENGFSLVTLEGYKAPVKLLGDVIARHKPTVGWYYIKHPDGYQSFCPPESFTASYKEYDPTTPYEKQLSTDRHLSEQEVKTITSLSAVRKQVERLVGSFEVMTRNRDNPDAPIPDKDWLQEGKKHLQLGFMALVRSITKPNHF